MAKLSRLVSDTLVYGVTTVLGRVLSWFLTPLYTHTIERAEVGEVSYLYSVIAVMLVVVTMGFETSYFRFAKDGDRDGLLRSLSLCVLAAGVVLTGMCWATGGGVWGLTGGIVALDAYNAVFFAELRYRGKSKAYALLRFASVVVVVGLTAFFLLWLRHRSAWGVDFGGMSAVSYIMLANLVGSAVCTAYFVPKAFSLRGGLSGEEMRGVMRYSLPLVGMGLLGMLNQNLDKLLMPVIIGGEEGMSTLGVYAANFKIGVLMAIFTQSFRLAFEPFVFKQGKDKKELYGPALKYFVHFGLLVFAGVTLFQKLIWELGVIDSSYEEGSVIIPVILVAELFYGVYYSLSMWYKMIDRTEFGVLMSGVGLAVNCGLLFLLTPRYGIMGAAVSVLVGYLVMMLMSFMLERRYYPVKYPLVEIGLTALGVFLTVFEAEWLNRSADFEGWWVRSLVAMAIVVLILLLSARSGRQ